MPLLKLETTIVLTPEQRQALLPAVSQLLAKTLGKPEQYVMVTVSSASIWFGGRGEPAAFGDLRAIGGLTEPIIQELAARLCDLLHQTLQIPPARVFLNFTDVPASAWGWNGTTFG